MATDELRLGAAARQVAPLPARRAVMLMSPAPLIDTAETTTPERGTGESARFVTSCGRSSEAAGGAVPQL